MKDQILDAVEAGDEGFGVSMDYLIDEVVDVGPGDEEYVGEYNGVYNHTLQLLWRGDLEEYECETVWWDYRQNLVYSLYDGDELVNRERRSHDEPDEYEERAGAETHRTFRLGE